MYCGRYPAGYCAFYMTFSMFRASLSLHLEDIYVRPALQDTGLGRHLIQAVCKIAQKRGCTRVEWVAPERDAAVNRFYESLEVSSVTGWKVYRARNTIVELAEAAPFDDDDLD
jgi:GNAT superfamily N-acetyltransferase